MTADTIERPSLGERYLSASQSSDITVRPGRTDADILLAAGFAAAGNANGQLALLLWRMRETRDLSGFTGAVTTSTNWVVGRSLRPGRGQLPKIRRIEAADMATQVLRWWLDQTCRPCEGRAHPFTLNTNRLDYTRDCPSCWGTGKSRVDGVVNQRFREHARWLAGEYDAMASQIFGAMARLLAPMLDLDMGEKK